MATKRGFARKMEEVTGDAIRYWEIMRIVYSLLILAVIGLAARFDWDTLSGDGVKIFFSLVVFNVLFSSAYLPDLLLQLSPYAARKCVVRPILFLFGSLLTALPLWWFWRLAC